MTGKVHQVTATSTASEQPRRKPGCADPHCESLKVKCVAEYYEDDFFCDMECEVCGAVWTEWYKYAGIIEA